MKTIREAQIRGWTDLELRCACGIEAIRPLNGFHAAQPDGDLKALAARLRCHICGQPPETTNLYRYASEGSWPYRRPLLNELERGTGRGR